MSCQRKKGQREFISKKLFLNQRLPENSRKGTASISRKEVDLKDILKKKWKVYRVSPIYNFDKNKLKLFENKLSHEMNAKKRVSTNFIYNCKFSLKEHIQLNNDCPEALEVGVTTNQGQFVYLGYFISWENTKQSLQGCISLPILLVEGKTYETAVVHSCLCKMFDCDIQPVTFSFCALISFLVKMLETARGNNDTDKEYLTLEYKVPDCNVKDNLKITLFLDDTTIVLAVIMENLQERYNEITIMEIMWEFYNRILNHIYNVFQVDLMLAELHKICFPEGYITSAGELKISTHDAGISALSILQCFTPLNAVTNF